MLRPTLQRAEEESLAHREREQGYLRELDKAVLDQRIALDAVHEAGKRVGPVRQHRPVWQQQLSPRHYDIDEAEAQRRKTRLLDELEVERTEAQARRARLLERTQPQKRHPEDCGDSREFRQTGIDRESSRFVTVSEELHSEAQAASVDLWHQFRHLPHVHKALQERIPLGSPT